ncbi:hypothetical protein [Halostella sp. PRR32]|uniref:hypothetical protein n=1 Tax=Halostella sp. PRR32 TaxID=3098147 RepID=UPI002B1E3ED2|nr:hypothetical protein [Halostella sp. PRR32]
MVDVPTAKRALAALARDACVSDASTDPEDERGTADGTASGANEPDSETADHRDVIDIAAAAVEDIDRAAAFDETVGLTRLRRAVERVPDRETKRRGQRALATYQRFRRVATDERGPAEARHRTADGDQFHCGRGTDLRRDRQRRDT